MRQRDRFTPAEFLNDVFRSKAAAQGGVVRRKRSDIERFFGLERFQAEMRSRGFSVVENGGQYVIFCNADPIKRIV